MSHLITIIHTLLLDCRVRRPSRFVEMRVLGALFENLCLRDLDDGWRGEGRRGSEGRARRVRRVSRERKTRWSPGTDVEGSPEVRASNRVALEMYERSGFEKVGRRSGYYERPREDALVLALTLEPAAVREQRPSDAV